MKKFIATISLALLACLAIAHSSIAQAQTASLADGRSGRIEFNSITPSSMWTYVRKNMTDTKQVVIYGDLLMPKNISGKVPALVLSHGSSGVSPYAYEVWAAQMNAAGVAIFIIDSFKPRGVNETAQDQTLVGPASQIADAMNALKLLATHPQIDNARIYNIGFSRGGSTAFYTAWPLFQRPVETNGAKFAGHIPVYPGHCNIRYRADAGTKATAPVFMALADRALEDWQDSAVCERYARELAAAGQPVAYKEYVGTYHAFDGRGKFFYFNNAYVSSKCDMEVQMTDVAGGGLGRDARDLKANKTLASYDDWNTAAKTCIGNVRARVGGDERQSTALVQDVLNFMGVNK